MQTRLVVCLALSLCLTFGSAQPTLRDAAQQLGVSIFASLVNFDDLESSQFNGLLLAPSDEAFDSATWLNSSETNQADVLNYHTLISRGGLPSASGPVPTRLQGRDVTVNIADVNGTAGNSSRVFRFFGDVSSAGTATTADCLTTNSQAAICRISKVLKIPRSTVYEYIASQEDLSILKQILDTQAPELRNATQDEDLVVTLYAPNNQALAAAGDVDPELIANIIRGHVVVHIAGIPLNLRTLADGSSRRQVAALGNILTVTKDENGNVTVASQPRGGAEGNNASVVKFNGNGGKAWVHTIDTILVTGAVANNTGNNTAPDNGTATETSTAPETSAAAEPSTTAPETSTTTPETSAAAGGAADAGTGSDSGAGGADGGAGGAAGGAGDGSGDGSDAGAGAGAGGSVGPGGFSGDAGADAGASGTSPAPAGGVTITA